MDDNLKIKYNRYFIIPGIFLSISCLILIAFVYIDEINTLIDIAFVIFLLIAGTFGEYIVIFLLIKPFISIKENTIEVDYPFKSLTKISTSKIDEIERESDNSINIFFKDDKGEDKNIPISFILMSNEDKQRFTDYITQF